MAHVREKLTARARRGFGGLLGLHQSCRTFGAGSFHAVDTESSEQGHGQRRGDTEQNCLAQIGVPTGVALGVGLDANEPIHDTAGGPDGRVGAKTAHPPKAGIQRLDIRLARRPCGSNRPGDNLTLTQHRAGPGGCWHPSVHPFGEDGHRIAPDAAHLRADCLGQCHDERGKCPFRVAARLRESGKLRGWRGEQFAALARSRGERTSDKNFGGVALHDLARGEQAERAERHQHGDGDTRRSDRGWERSHHKAPITDRPVFLLWHHTKHGGGAGLAAIAKPEWPPIAGRRRVPWVALSGPVGCRGRGALCRDAARDPPPDAAIQRPGACGDGSPEWQKRRSRQIARARRTTMQRRPTWWPVCAALRSIPGRGQGRPRGSRSRRGALPETASIGRSWRSRASAARKPAFGAANRSRARVHRHRATPATNDPDAAPKSAARRRRGPLRNCGRLESLLYMISRQQRSRQRNAQYWAGWKAIPAVKCRPSSARLVSTLSVGWYTGKNRIVCVE